MISWVFFNPNKSKYDTLKSDINLKVTGKTPKVEWDNSKPTTIPFRSCSTDRISKELGFQPKYSFEEGIQETVEWYLENNK